MDQVSDRTNHNPPEPSGHHCHAKRYVFYFIAARFYTFS